MKTNPEASQMRHTTNIKHTPCATAKAPREREKKRSEDVEPVKEIHQPKCANIKARISGCIATYLSLGANETNDMQINKFPTHTPAEKICSIQKITKQKRIWGVEK